MAHCLILKLNSTGPHWYQEAIIIHNLLILRIQKKTMTTNSHSKLMPKQKESTQNISNKKTDFVYNVLIFATS